MIGQVRGNATRLQPEARRGATVQADQVSHHESAVEDLRANGGLRIVMVRP